MTRWYASVVNGLEEAVGNILKHHGAKDISIIESAVIFYCENVLDLKCINNLFAIVAAFSAESVAQAAGTLLKKDLCFPKINGATFRIIIMDCGKLRPLPSPILRELEKAVQRKTHLRPHRANPVVEIWLNRRNSGEIYFMVRMKKHASFDKSLKKGELRPDIVAVMLHEANVTEASVMADLFGGWGAIAAFAAAHTRCKKIYTGDIQDACIQYQKKRLRKFRHCHIQQWDGLNTPLTDASIDAVVTDPPWGEYASIDAPAFYNAFIKEAARILRTGGLLVFLSSAHEEARQALEHHGFSYSFIPFKMSGKDTFLYRACAS